VLRIGDTVWRGHSTVGSLGPFLAVASIRRSTPSQILQEVTEMSTVGHPGSRVVSAMRYRDAAAAIDWLCDAFGFERHLVVAGEDGSIAHAQLVFGNGMIMLGTARDDEFGAFVKTPAEAGGKTTQSVYVIVADADAHHACAVAAGAEILIDLIDEDYGGRAYTCRDPEGHIWTFGTYDPWSSD